MDVSAYPGLAASYRRAGLIRAQQFASVVEGKSYTTAQVAKRLGVSLKSASRRIKRGPFPLTWASLESARRISQ
ncbi:hypothetical protein [Stenotrophomonas sp. NPDC078853]|uniref:hypothetical protein n=1 Tax=Stenotrophomonas sp. NPDC078853 TaxID=3364534 RepID=UPI00384AD047